MKGCQREMIVLRTNESALFESAYFVLRRQREVADGGDMLAEANRLLGASGAFTQKRRRRGRLLPFLLGFLLGSCIFAAILAVVLLCP